MSEPYEGRLARLLLKRPQAVYVVSTVPMGCFMLYLTMDMLADQRTRWIGLVFMVPMLAGFIALTFMIVRLQRALERLEERT